MLGTRSKRGQKQRRVQFGADSVGVGTPRESVGQPVHAAEISSVWFGSEAVATGKKLSTWRLNSRRNRWEGDHRKARAWSLRCRRRKRRHHAYKRQRGKKNPHVTIRSYSLLVNVCNYILTEHVFRMILSGNFNINFNSAEAEPLIQFLNEKLKLNTNKAHSTTRSGTTTLSWASRCVFSLFRKFDLENCFRESFIEFYILWVFHSLTDNF